MDGVSAFAHGLHTFLILLMGSVVLGVVGIVVTALSVANFYVKKRYTKSLILAATGTVLLIPAIMIGIIFIVSFIEQCLHGLLQWQRFPIAVIISATIVYVIVYDIKVVRKI